MIRQSTTEQSDESLLADAIDHPELLEDLQEHDLDRLLRDLNVDVNRLVQGAARIVEGSDHTTKSEAQGRTLTDKSPKAAMVAVERSRQASALRALARGITGALYHCIESPLRRASQALGVLLVAAGGYDPETLRLCTMGQRWSAYRSGLQVLVGGSFVAAASYTAMSIALGTEASVPLLIAVALVMSSVVMLFDIATIEKARQLQAEREVSAYTTGQRRDVRGLLKIGILVTTRLSIAVFNATLIATLLMTVVLHKDIHTAIKEDAYDKNMPIVAEATSSVDALIATRREALVAAERLLLDLNQQEAASNERLAAQSAQDPAQLDDVIKNLHQREQDNQAQADRLRRTITCEESGVRCDGESSGRAGKGPRYEEAVRQLAGFLSEMHELQQQIIDLQEKRASSLRSRAEAIATDEAQRRQAIVVASDSVKSARAEYTRALSDREAKIATYVQTNPAYVEPAAGLVVEIRELNLLSDKFGVGIFIVSLKGLLILLELSALATALLWPTRHNAPVREYLEYVIDLEGTVVKAERERRQRPSARRLPRHQKTSSLPWPQNAPPANVPSRV